MTWKFALKIGTSLGLGCSKAGSYCAMSNFDPYKFSQRRYPSFKHVLEPLQQPQPYKCKKGCRCDGLDCPCFVNHTTCEASCGCDTCLRRFPGCNCEYECDNTNCPCRGYDRDCVDGHCECQACKNKHDSQTLPLVEIKPSSMPGAGDGLFAKDDVLADTLLGEYRGRLVSDNKGLKSRYVARFAFSKGQRFHSGACKSEQEQIILSRQRGTVS